MIENTMKYFSLIVNTTFVYQYSHKELMMISINLLETAREVD